jgi:hypothetical protein
MIEEPPLWNYRYRFIILLVLLALILLIGICLAEGQKPLKTANRGELERSSGSSDMFLEPISPHYVPYTETYGSLIDKIAFCESSNNPEAVNWNDNGSPSWGLLQFKETTFQHFCVNKYNLPNDIMDGDIQRECADRMIRAGLAYHWTCYFKVK